MLAYHEVYDTALGWVRVYEAEVDCCCLSNNSFAWTQYAEGVARFQGQITGRRLREGAGVGPGFVRDRLWLTGSEFGGGPLELVHDLQEPHSPSCFPIPGPSPVVWSFGGQLVTGERRSTCSVFEAGLTTASSPPGLTATAHVRATNSGQQVGCVSSSCRTCCLPDDTCVLTLPADCRAAGGIPGSGADCGAINCGTLGTRPRGACCLADGSCAPGVTLGQCTLQGGVWNGEGSTCAAANCQPFVRACCLPNGNLCAEMTQLACLAAQGTWYATAHCAQVNCNNLSACCYPDGTCAMATANVCAGNLGIWHPGMDCSQVVCEPCLGACCRLIQGSLVCNDETQANCALAGSHGIPPGTWYGCGTSCATIQCSAPAPGGVRMATGRETVAFGSGAGQPCSGCGDAAKAIQPWA